MLIKLTALPQVILFSNFNKLINGKTDMLYSYALSFSLFLIPKDVSKPQCILSLFFNAFSCVIGRRVRGFLLFPLLCQIYTWGFPNPRLNMWIWVERETFSIGRCHFINKWLYWLDWLKEGTWVQFKNITMVQWTWNIDC